ncbi:hypothetical protein [Sediminibacillus albus]|uniref:Stage II sporulation protein M n=1 Tax=Sediminibacillus albus TaxID=407036 RepID=A0A1G9A596_9BACI|nr:hypothetical protein [Sediminibacillus albus]SDK21765.1 hypothetical protein SAMN05216243_2387 [Sediminibacillus albus]
MISSPIKYSLYFFFGSILLVVFGYISTEHSGNPEVISDLNMVDLMYIALINGGIYLLLLLFSFTGIPLLFVLKFLIGIGASGKLSDIPPMQYYLSSFIHGIGEIYICFLITSVTITQIAIIFGVIRKKMDVSEITIFLKRTFPRYILIGLGIVVINAFTEVYISNTLIKLFQ